VLLLLLLLLLLQVKRWDRSVGAWRGIALGSSCLRIGVLAFALFDMDDFMALCS